MLYRSRESRKCQTEVVDFLLTCPGLLVNAASKDDGGETALHFCCKKSTRLAALK